ncbi:glucose-1-phosphate thymidylyltransferase [Streptomyces sp. NPDC052101]|uniref:glucose-1-phosphate thymidylyltransferase n=1 Tax=Streptomyces sp. NPDC052101 TaxID=3155763 RepID=UPI0034451737
MKALVLSGGMGTRLRPFTYSMPKQLIPVANQPVLIHVMDNLRALGISQAGVVVGDRGDEIAAVLGDGSSIGIEITYIRQDTPRGLAHCVSLARDFLGADDFVMYLGDVMLSEGITEMAERFRANRPAAQVVVQKVTDPRAFGVAELAADGRVTALVEKPQHPTSDLAMVGVYFFTPAIHEAVAAIRPSARGELEITDAVQWLVSNNCDVRAEVYTGFWKDTGRVEDVIECNRQLLDALTPSVPDGVCADSELVGPVLIDPTARVVRSRITGPGVVGAGTVIEDSRIGPYTAIGENCVVSNADVADSIVLSGATVRDIVGIHSSVIGRGAAVSSGDGRHRLVVGDHSSVEVAV